MSKKLSKTKRSKLDSIKQSVQVKSDPTKDSKTEFTSKADSKSKLRSKSNTKSKSTSRGTDSKIKPGSKTDIKSKVESKSISKSKLDSKAIPKSKSTKQKTSSKIKADSKANTRSKSKPRTDSKAEADSKANTRSKSKPRTDSKAEADSKADTRSKSKPKTDSIMGADPKADSKSKSKPKTDANKKGSGSQVSMKKAKSKPDVELKKTKPDSKTKKKSGSKSSVPSVTTSLTMTSGSSGSVSKTGSKPGLKGGTASKAGSKTGAKAGSKPDKKPNTKSKAKPRAKSEPKPKAKSEPKPKSKPGSGEIMKINEKNAFQAFQDLQKDPKCKSLLKKHLTKELFDKLMKKKTKMGSTLLDCVQTGLANHDSDIGVYAPDPDAYNAFSDLFNPIIEDYHGFKKTDKHPKPDFGKLDKFIDLDKNKEFIISTRIRCGRSLKGMPFNPCMKKEHYQELEKKISGVLAKIPDEELKGTYMPLAKMSKQEQKKLIDQHFLFKEGDKFLQAGNACRFWPTGRGIFLNKDKTFMVWIGEEDHIRIISMQDGANVKDIYSRLIKAIKYLESKCEFVRDSRLGYLTFCPTNLGTTLRASVMIKLPKLGKKVEELEATAEKMKLQVRGSAGEHTESPDGIYDVSNKRRLGLTEGQAVMEMQEGVLKLIEMEKKKK